MFFSNRDFFRNTPNMEHMEYMEIEFFFELFITLHDMIEMVAQSEVNTLEEKEKAEVCVMPKFQLKSANAIMENLYTLLVTVTIRPLYRVLQLAIFTHIIVYW